jgi:hypothetical protein
MKKIAYIFTPFLCEFQKYNRCTATKLLLIFIISNYFPFHKRSSNILQIGILHTEKFVAVFATSIGRPHQSAFLNGWN